LPPPDPAILAPRSGDQEGIRTFRPGIEHRHAPAAPEQVDLDETHVAQQDALALSLVEFPALGARALVGGREDLNERFSLFALCSVSVEELIVKKTRSPHFFSV
jgi:hypothetical protein